MDFKDLLEKRRSVRNFLDKEVEAKKITNILEKARQAPSAHNYQPWKILVVKDEEKKQLVYSTYSRTWIQKAPVILILCIDHSKSWKREFDDKDHSDIDAGIFGTYLSLAAEEEELGTCWVCAFDAKLLKTHFKLPENVEPVAFFPLGYPDPSCFEKPKTPREKLSDIQRNEIYY